MKIKSILIFLLILSVSNIVSGQKQEKLYYDAEWKRVSSNSKAAFYRIINFDGEGKYEGLVRDYYITGEIQGEGEPISIDKEDDSNSKWKNFVKGYYKSGNKRFENYFTEQGLPNGLWLTWFENGQLQSEIEYKSGLFNGKNISYHENGKIRFMAEFKEGKLIGKWVLDCDEFGHCQKVFQDAFFSEENINDWPLQNNDLFKTKIVEKKGLRMQSIREQGYIQYIHVPLNIDKGFSIETIINYEQGLENSAAGLIWGFKNWENYNYFSISKNGQFSIGSMSDGINLPFVKWQSTNEINQKTNRNLIKISKIGDKVYYSINGHLVHSMDFYAPRSNNVGFQILQGKSQFLFENLLIREDSESLSNNVISSKWKGTGSGFIIESRGYILTNYHVVENASEIEVDVILNGIKKSYKAITIETDKQNDLALIKINDPDFKPLPKLLYNFKSNISDVGTNVFALGFPLTSIMGEEIKFTDGKISSKTGFQGDITTYQISVPVQPGNSGGPLFDFDGNVIGIVNSKIMKADNVSYAIKISYARNLIDVLTEQVNLPNDNSMASAPLTEKIKTFSNYVVFIKIQ
jgi:S1-C subfamily serine protease